MAKLKLIVSIILIGIVLGIILTLCILKQPGVKHNFSIENSFNIYKLTDEDYDSVGTSGLENPTKNDFRRAVISVDIQGKEEIDDLKFKVPNSGDIRDALGFEDVSRYWFCDEYEQNNQGEDFSQYECEFIFYSKGLNDNDIKKLFSNLSIKLSWSNKYRTTNEHTTLLSDIIIFNY